MSVNEKYSGGIKRPQKIHFQTLDNELRTTVRRPWGGGQIPFLNLLTLLHFCLNFFPFFPFFLRKQKPWAATLLLTGQAAGVDEINPPPRSKDENSFGLPDGNKGCITFKGFRKCLRFCGERRVERDQQTLFHVFDIVPNVENVQIF